LPSAQCEVRLNPVKRLFALLLCVWWVGCGAQPPASVRVEPTAKAPSNQAAVAARSLASSPVTASGAVETEPVFHLATAQAGASVINDIEAHRTVPELWKTVAATGAGYVLMHMQGTPQTMQQDPHYEDVVQEVSGFFGERILRLEEQGVRREQVLLDPGIGFGKTLAHNLSLLRGFGVISALKRPMLLGVSRKSFIGRLFGAEPDQRIGASVACALWAAEAGVTVFRVHDVAQTVQALRMREILNNQTNTR
jgi:dihydropteroate synthase